MTRPHHDTSRATRGLAVLVLTLVTHLLAVAPGDTVLCLGSDGHSRIECRTDAGCGCDHGCSAAPVPSASAEAAGVIGRVHDGRDGCVDVPLASSEDTVARSRAAAASRLDPSTDAVAVWFATFASGAALVSPRAEIVRESPVSGPTDRVRTVVLRF